MRCAEGGYAEIGGVLVGSSGLGIPGVLRVCGGPAVRCPRPLPQYPARHRPCPAHVAPTPTPPSPPPPPTPPPPPAPPPPSSPSAPRTSILCSAASLRLGRTYMFMTWRQSSSSSSSSGRAGNRLSTDACQQGLDAAEQDAAGKEAGSTPPLGSTHTNHTSTSSTDPKPVPGLRRQALHARTRDRTRC